MSIRRAIVIGGGGVLGGTWAVGALRALEEARGFDARSADLLVGTSAGSVLVSLLGNGVSVSELMQHYRDDAVTSGPLAGYSWSADRAAGGHRPPMPRNWLPGSPALMRESVIHPGQKNATAVLSAFLPEGGRSLERVGHLVDAVTPMGQWAAHDGVWVIAMDYASGRRTVFGRSGAPQVPLRSAVMASCAIPGWFAPVRIGEHSYIDGGAVSATSVDVVSHADLDEVYVIAPMAAADSGRASGLVGWLDRLWRDQVTSVCDREVAQVRATGASVFIAQPSGEDLKAMGGNMMDSSRKARVLETSLRTSRETWQE
jgi:NTE family protein